MNWILLYLLAAALLLAWLARDENMRRVEWADLGLAALLWPIAPILRPLAQRWHRHQWERRRPQRDEGGDSDVCEHPDWSFDRTICGGCDSMPTACVECGWHDCEGRDSGHG